GEERQLDFVVKPNTFEGKVKALDSTPLGSVVVQAIWFGSNATPGSTAKVSVPEWEPGLLGEYFDLGVALEYFPSVVNLKPVLTRVDRTVNFPQEYAFTDTGLQDDFYIRWSGKIRIGKPGRYTFSILADDGGRVFIDDRKIVDNQLKWDVEAFDDVQLSSGDHDLTIEFFQKKFG